MSEYYQADATIIKMAEELIANFHPEVSDASFGFFIKAKTSKNDVERGIVCSAKKVSPLYNVITGLDFIIILSGDLWLPLSETEKKIKLDSSLTCCAVKMNEEGDEKLTEDGRPIYELTPPDLVEHIKILDRYGLQAVSSIEDKLRKLCQTTKNEDEYDDEGDHEQPVSGKGKKGTRKTATGS
jgi:hypothetical protein